jgi:hypothetical protein
MIQSAYFLKQRILKWWLAGAGDWGTRKFGGWYKYFMLIVNVYTKYTFRKIIHIKLVNCILSKVCPYKTKILFFKFLFYSYVHTMFGSFLPPAPTSSLTTHSASLPPPSPPPPPRYPAETILPLSLILLKREYKQ